MARTTIKDIAKRLNINPSTVSRALRDHPDVSVQLKETIRQLADKMGYKPNHMAINLRRGSSHTIGLIIPEIAPFFFPSVIRAVEEATHEKGYNLLILHSNDSIDREIENAEICANMGVDGILVSLSRQSHDIEHFQELMAAGIPIVFFDKIIPGTHAHKVVMPGFQAASLAIEKLLSDHPVSKKVTGFFADSRMSITEDRLQGFRQTMESHGRHIDDSDIVYTDTPEAAKQKLIERWNSENRPDAIFAMSDEILSGIIQAVYELGIRIPEDLHLVAISDGQLPLHVPFPIAFVRTSGYDLGLAAAGLLFQLIMKLPIVPDTHYLEVELVNNGR